MEQSSTDCALQVAHVHALDYEGRGVAKVGGKAVFIEGALPHEVVAFHVVRSKKQFDEARVVKVLKAAPARVVPQCRHFDTCGGCVLQHADFNAQVAYKQRLLEDQLWRLGKVRPKKLLPPIYGQSWHYRHRGRLSVGLDDEGKVILGFKARRSHQIVNIDGCLVLPKHISEALPVLQALLQNWMSYGVQTEGVGFSVGEGVNIFTIYSLREPIRALLENLEQWLNKLPETGYPWQFRIRIKGREGEICYPENAPSLSYGLPDFGVVMPYDPENFTQVNPVMNALMVSRAITLLDPRPGERIADLFCGMGNFTLPIAASGVEVVGIEGLDCLVRQARYNAKINGFLSNIKFYTEDLFKTNAASLAGWGYFDKILLDPPRSGAQAVVSALCKPYLPRRIVYVSCNPSTLARDAGILVAKGYRFEAAGVMNMFSQTAHIEAVALFEYEAI
ncbi:23S rRNA methyltransferase [Neisseria arctica]|uniref:23S rRNA (uracil(1939)-C(5))-methyltransferase RlmD n=1 Tax=Neisseria arctica TaxID=1470200 RepID=A0A0J0YS42_9NEIS|nr:23S rRNA (uracil(1939)-C(5))-methyltransferase RlmD [Neisseria arctica]KLT72922.1 23S rRNA methyltransferase [Neisseria arctica]UOO86421.1 23S rRNA (uracil(1939)-C(5))-methyltransferase RlmD [Neisseria arctica]